MESGPPHKALAEAIRRKKAHRSRFWSAILEAVEKPRSRRPSVDLGRLARFGREDKIVVVPGKVLGSGSLDKKLRIAALSFSQSAKKKVERAGGECLTITSLLEERVEGKDLMIIG
ncbi:MAG: 50S ribosomal protein L18e [Candidatus Bathyarchaeia archaeon]